MNRNLVVVFFKIPEHTPRNTHPAAPLRLNVSSLKRGYYFLLLLIDVGFLCARLAATKVYADKRRTLDSVIPEIAVKTLL
jgi:hypothetical protein